MGTRHSTVVFHDGKYKVAQYGQWDGYVSGQGIGILAFLRDKMRGSFVPKALDKIFYPTDVQIEEYQSIIEKTPNASIRSLYPSLSRDTGGDILELLQDSTEPVPLRLDINFLADSLFCEYAYIVDFDKGTFEVYRGFNKEPLTPEDRFYSLELHEKGRSGDQYYPVKLIATFDLAKLPTDQEFLETFAEPDEEEETSEPTPATEA